MSLRNKTCCDLQPDLHHYLVCKRGCCNKGKILSKPQTPFDPPVSLLSLAVKPTSYSYTSSHLANKDFLSKRVASLLRAVCIYNADRCYPNSSWWWFENNTREAQDVQEVIDKVLDKLLDPCNIVIAAAVLLDRVNWAGAPLRRSNIARVFSACLLLAIKLTEETTVRNSHLTFLFTCPIHVVHILEAQVLRIIDWRLLVTESTFAQYASAITWPLIQCRASPQLGLRRDEQAIEVRKVVRQVDVAQGGQLHDG